MEVYNNALRDLLGGRDAPYINDQSAIKHDPAGGHTIVAGVNKVRGLVWAVLLVQCVRALATRHRARWLKQVVTRVNEFVLHTSATLCVVLLLLTCIWGCAC